MAERTTRTSLATRARRGVHRFLLHLYRRLPARARRSLVRSLSPSFTVGSICVIERPDGHLLLIQHAYRDRWGIPGGLLKRGEDPSDAARREVMEEVGLAIELVGEPAVVVDALPQRVDIVFRARPASLEALGKMRPSSPEITAARWFSRDALPELQHETAHALVALARSAHSPQAPPLPGAAFSDRLL